MKTASYILLCLLLLSSCNMSRQYANYRHGGKSEKINSSYEIYENKTSEEINSLEPEFEIIEMQNPDNLLIADRKINSMEFLSTPIEPIIFIDSIHTPDTSFLMDDELATAYSAAAFNGVGAIFGFLTFANANFLYLSLPIYVIALPIINVIGIICFFISLAKFSQGKLDGRNKKYYKIWLFLFCLSVLLALTPLLMFI